MPWGGETQDECPPRARRWTPLEPRQKPGGLSAGGAVVQPTAATTAGMDSRRYSRTHTLFPNTGVCVS